MAMKNFVTGDVLTEGDLDVYCVNTIFARKTATESVTATTVLQDDDHLTVTVAANSVYELTCMLRYDGATGGDLKWQFVGPAGATLSAVYLGLQTTAATTSDDLSKYFNISSAPNVGALGAGTDVGVTMSGLLIVAGTAGTFKLQWAQDTASGTATRLFADSYLCLRRVD